MARFSWDRFKTSVGPMLLGIVTSGACSLITTKIKEKIDESKNLTEDQKEFRKNVVDVTSGIGQLVWSGYAIGAGIAPEFHKGWFAAQAGRSADKLAEKIVFGAPYKTAEIFGASYRPVRVKRIVVREPAPAVENVVVPEEEEKARLEVVPVETMRGRLV